MGFSPKEQLEEYEHFLNVCQSFRSYRIYSLESNNKRRTDFHSLSAQHQELLPNQKALLRQIDQAIVDNADWLDDVVDQNAAMCPALDPGLEQAAAEIRKKHYRVSEGDLEKVRSTFRQCVRDWSEEGKDERDATYNPIIEGIENYTCEIYSSDNLSAAQRGQIKVLVPGTGLGRLPWELAKRGYAAQGNEFSLHMLFVANTILNNTTNPLSYTVFPYAHSLSNIRTSSSALRAIRIPDVDPTDLPPEADFSMCAGDWLDAYDNKESYGQWDVIVTCFFLDTARNVILYLELIRKLLSPRGRWINLGPTLWHFEGSSKGEASIELPLDEVLALIRRLGFNIENQREVKTRYTSNLESLLSYTYDAIYWEATVDKSA